jgi:hypothetical protein
MANEMGPLSYLILADIMMPEKVGITTEVMPY